MSISFLGSQAVESGVIASSRPKTATPAGANSKGTWQQNIASTTGPTAWVQVGLLRPAQISDYLVDIGVGAASSETVIIANLPLSANATASPPEAVFLFPLFIPAGSRVACRAQGSAGAFAVDCQVTLFAPMFGGELGLGQVEACGAVTATSLGTSVDPGGTANTKGTPQQLIAATAFAYKWACVSVNHTNALAALTSWTVDIMVGGSGSEVVVVPDLCFYTSTVSDTLHAIGQCFPLAIPAGTRISARCQSNITTASERLLEIVLHGVG